MKTVIGIATVIVILTQQLNVESAKLQLRKRKGGDEQLLPLPENLCNELMTYYNVYRPMLIKGKTGGLFLNQYGNPIGTKGIRDVFDKARDKAGLSKSYHPHSLRKACTTELVTKEGVDIYMVKELLGHSHLQTIQYYCELKPDHLRSTLEKYHPLEVVDHV